MPFLKFQSVSPEKRSHDQIFWNEVIEAGLFKKVLKANVRGRILSWSNWGLCHCFPLQSDSPDDAVFLHLLGIVGEKRQSRRRPPNLPAALLCGGP
jgi:hypothetical protein